MKKIVIRNNEIHHKIKKSIFNFITKTSLFELKYIGQFASIVSYKERNDIPTVGFYSVGDEIIFAWNKNFIDNLSEKQVNFLILHEFSNLIKNSHSNDNEQFDFDLHYYPMEDIQNQSIKNITRQILSKYIKNFSFDNNNFIKNIKRDCGKWSNVYDLLKRFETPILNSFEKIETPTLFDKKSIVLDNNIINKSNNDLYVENIINNDYDNVEISRYKLLDIIEDIKNLYIEFEKLDINQINNLTNFFENIDEIFILRYIDVLFHDEEVVKKESFQPCGEINVLLNHNIQSNIDFIKKNQPEYKFPKTYSYLKQSVFSNSIHLFKSI